MRKRLTQMVSLTLALILALGLHSLLLIPRFNFSIIKKSEDAIEVDKLDRSVVFSMRPKKQSDSGKAKFLGAFRNRVEKEMRAPHSGRFIEGRAMARLDGYGEQSPLIQLGQTPNFLPDDIPKGDETLLNTDRYRYAGFMNRIADTIYQPWVDEVEMAKGLLALSGKSIDSDFYVTRISVTINSTGEVVGIKLIKGSGVDAFDEATKHAFWRVVEFPNPPAELFKDSETVRLEYEFHLELHRSFFEVFPATV